MKKFLTLFLTMSLMFILAACGGDKEEQTKDSDAARDSKTDQVIDVKHELDDQAVQVPANPEKVVVFDLGALDTMDELGLGDKIVGLPQATVPSYLEQYKSSDYENLGSLKEPDFEKVHASKPDLIIISTRQAELYDQFKEIAPTIYLAIDDKDYLNSFEANVETIGKIFNKEEEVKTALKEIEEKVASVQEATAKTEDKGLIVLGTEGKVSAYGPGSRFGLIHDVLGVDPADDKIENSRHGQSITFEYILETNPDMMFIVDRDTAIGQDSSVKESLENEIVQKTNAFQNDKMIYLDGEVWYLAGGGLESMNIMIDEVAAAFK